MGQPFAAADGCLGALLITCFRLIWVMRSRSWAIWSVKRRFHGPAPRLRPHLEVLALCLWPGGIEISGLAAAAAQGHAATALRAVGEVPADAGQGEGCRRRRVTCRKSALSRPASLAAGKAEALAVAAGPGLMLRQPSPKRCLYKDHPLVSPPKRSATVWPAIRTEVLKGADMKPEQVMLLTQGVGSPSACCCMSCVRCCPWVGAIQSGAWWEF